MKKLNFVFIALLTCMFISCKPTVDTYPCEHCGILYFTEEEAEACPCERTCSKCGFVYDTPEEAKECSKHIGCPHGYLSADAREKYVYEENDATIADPQDLENVRNLYKEICDYVKASEFDDSYKNLCTLDFSGVNNVSYYSGIDNDDEDKTEYTDLIIKLSNNSLIIYIKYVDEAAEYKVK